MAEPYVWPLGLPQFPEREQYRKAPPSNTLTAKMEYGPEKTRRRGTANPGKIRVRFLLEEITVPDGAEGNVNQLETWEAFYAIVECAMSFWLPNPKKETEYMLVRIVADGEEEGPPVTPAGAFSWYLDLTLKVFSNTPQRLRNA